MAVKPDEENICYRSAAELARMIREKEISPVEVVSAFIRRIEEINPKVNAFCTLTFDRAFDEAKRAEQAVGGDGRQAPGPAAWRRVFR